jgi:O-antigen/teichoic acid export membrane protein
MVDVEVSQERPDQGVELALRTGGRLLAHRAAQYGLAFLAGIIITRELGPSGRAGYALPLALSSTVWITTHLSIEAAAQRLLGRREATLREVAGLLAAATLGISVVGVAVTIVVGMLVRTALLGGVPPVSVVIAALTIPFSVAGQLSAALLFRLGALRAYGLIVAASGALQLALAISLAAAWHIDSRIALLIALAVIAATGIGLCAVLARHIGASALVPRASRALARSAFGAGLKLHASSLALYLNLKLDLLLVSALTNPHQTGLYSLSASLAELVFVATSTVSLSALQTQVEADEAHAAEYTVSFTRQTLALSVVIAALAAAGGFPFIVLAYGSTWIPSVAPFAVLTLAAVGLGVEMPTRNLLIRIARPLTISAAAIAALAINVGANLALIPQIGIMGSALASVLSYWVAALLMVWLVRRATQIPMRRTLTWPGSDEPIRELISLAFARRRGRGRQAAGAREP